MQLVSAVSVRPDLQQAKRPVGLCLARRATQRPCRDKIRSFRKGLVTDVRRQGHPGALSRAAGSVLAALQLPVAQRVERPRKIVAKRVVTDATYTQQRQSQASSKHSGGGQGKVDALRRC